MAQIGINCGGRPVLRVYGVKAQLEELDAPFSLDYAGEKAAGPKAEYCFASHGVEIKLTLKYSGSVTLGWLEGKVAQQGQGFHRQRSFRADHGVTVEFAQEPHCTGVMANYGHKDWWTRPAFTAQFQDLPTRVQSVLWHEGEEYYYLLPVVDEACASARGIPGGLGLTLSLGANGFNSFTSLAFAVGRGKDPYALVQAVAEAALIELPHGALPRREKAYPPILEYLGWCSWDAFYKEVSGDGLRAKARELREKNVPVKWFMIDDGWLDVKEGKLWSFRADQSKFPGGLGETVQTLKGAYGVQWVGVWHTTAGYWDGIHPGSELVKTHGQYLYQTRRGSILPHPEAQRGFAFWRSWHQQLKAQGIDFVKVDGQSAAANYFRGEQPIPKACRSIHQGLEGSVGMHFGLNLINCMGMAGENLWSRPASALSRSSDDFVPSGEIPFAEHALQNAYNSLYHSQFYWGDWDMFWSDHPEARQSAVLRALSGGPVYISDPVGRTCPEVILPLALRDGKILRLDHPGLPAEDCLLRNPHTDGVPLKIWGTIQVEGLPLAGIIGLFNLDQAERTLTCTVSPRDIPTLEGERSVLYDHFEGTAQVLAGDEMAEVSLSSGEVKLFVVVPQGKKVTPLGLVDKYLSPGAIRHFAEGEVGAELVLQDGGLAAFAAAKEPREVLVNGTQAAWEQRDGFFIVDCTDVMGTCVVSIRL
jgi:hypothetical protein